MWNDERKKRSYRYNFVISSLSELSIPIFASSEFSGRDHDFDQFQVCSFSSQICLVFWLLLHVHSSASEMIKTDITSFAGNTDTERNFESIISAACKAKMDFNFMVDLDWSKKRNIN